MEGVMNFIGAYVFKDYVISTWIVMGVTLPVLYLIGKNLKRFPDKAQFTIEALTGFIQGVLEDAMGKYGKQFTSFIGSLALFILFCNLSGLVPGLAQPTSHLNTTVAVAVVAFLVYNYEGMKKQGVVSYLRHLLGPSLLLAPIFFPIELISHLARILSLSVRLFGNMFGDEMIVFAFSLVIPFLLPVAGEFIVFLNSFFQAFVFCLLTVIYISLAVEESEEH